MKDIYLYGFLGKEFGKKHTLAVSSVAEAVRALCAIYPDFKKSLRSGQYKIRTGKTYLQDPDETLLSHTGNYHIVPVVEGAKKGGIFGIILGVVMIAAAFYTGGASIAAWSAMQTSMAMMGAAMVLGGIATMMTPVPQMTDYSQREKPDERPSYLFNGPVNTVEQGGCNNLIYGRMITGSTVLAAEIDVEQL